MARAVALLLASLLLAACTKGKECDTCSKDADCNSPLVCTTFLGDDGKPLDQKRCGSGIGATQCRVH